MGHDIKHTYKTHKIPNAYVPYSIKNPWFSHLFRAKKSSSKIISIITKVWGGGALLISQIASTRMPGKKKIYSLNSPHTANRLSTYFSAQYLESWNFHMNFLYDYVKVPREASWLISFTLTIPEWHPQLTLSLSISARH